MDGRMYELGVTMLSMGVFLNISEIEKVPLNPLEIG